MCLEVHGAAPLWVPIPKWEIQWNGRRPALTWWQSSLTVRRGFCANCGEPMVWDKRWWPRLFVPAASLRNAPILPEQSIYQGAGWAIRLPGVHQPWPTAKRRLVGQQS
jgi:hypothetical protein